MSVFYFNTGSSHVMYSLCPYSTLTLGQVMSCIVCQYSTLTLGQVMSCIVYVRIILHLCKGCKTNKKIATTKSSKYENLAQFE